MELDLIDSASAIPYNIQEVCRLCLSDREDSLKSIHDPILGPNRIPQKIQLLLQIQISKNDGLSKMVCNDCIIRLDTWFAYKQQCHKTQTKLAEWLNIATNDQFNPSEIHIKEEPYDGTLPGMDIEVTQDNQELSDLNSYSHDGSYSNNFDIKNIETDDDRRCPECNRMFGSAQNRRRHQNMLHAKKERRERMPEIQKSSALKRPRETSPLSEKNHPGKKSQPSGTSQPSETSQLSEKILPTEISDSSEKIENRTEQDMEIKPISQTVSISGIDFKGVKQEKISDTSGIVNSIANDTNDTNTSNVNTTAMNETGRALKTEFDTTADTSATAETSATGDISASAEINATADISAAAEISATQDISAAAEISATSETSTTAETSATADALATADTPATDDTSATAGTSANVDTSANDDTSATAGTSAIGNQEHSSVDPQENQQKILFAAGLKLRQKDSNQAQTDSLSKLELCYLEKCHALVTMHLTLKCACHNIQQKSRRNLFSHLRETRIWFPLFTCYHCMISFTDRSTFTRHASKCARGVFLENLKKLASLRERSLFKSRVYQNFKCNLCKFIFSFHGDFCQHFCEAHAYGEPPYYCACRCVFDSLEEYKMHNFSSCAVSYYCDICFITTNTVEEFIKHAEEMHDDSEGFELFQGNTYTPRSSGFRHKEADDQANIIEGKRERRKSSREPVVVQIYDNEIPKDLKDIPTRVIREMILGTVPYPMPTGENANKTPTSCPFCQKQYSNVNNMLRHYRTHIEKGEVDPPKLAKGDDNQEDDINVEDSVYDEEEPYDDYLLYSCNECDQSFTFSAYRNHKLEMHNIVVASEDEDDNNGTSLLKERFSEYNIETQSSEANKDLFCEVCHQRFTNVNDFVDHCKNLYCKLKYPKQCDQCNKIIATCEEYGQHMQMHNTINNSNKTGGEYPKQCEYCDKVCSTPAGYHLHTQMHEKVTLGDIKTTKHSEEEEEEGEEDESYHTCKRCFKVFGTKGKLKEHMRSHGITSKSNKKQRKVLCDLCHVAVDDQESLAKHKAEEHSDETDEMPVLTSEVETGVMYACEICEFTFRSVADLAAHRSTHLVNPKTKQHTCKYCKVSFNSSNDLTKHMNLAHNESAKPKTTKDHKPFKCPVCRKGFISHGAMTTHSGWHKRGKGKGGKSYKNTLRGTAAAKLDKRDRVLRKITTATAVIPKVEPDVESPEFICPHCLMELPNDTALQIHILENHDDLDAQMLIPRCNNCNKDFTTQAEYDIHKRFHDFLERQKKHEKLMLEQKSIHQTPVISNVQSVAESRSASPNIKRFPCSWCSSIFSRQDTLNTHIKQRHAEHVRTSFECTECDRVFDKQNALTIHLKMHTKQRLNPVALPIRNAPILNVGGTKMFRCSLCNMSFKFPKDLRMHTITAHPF